MKNEVQNDTVYALSMDSVMVVAFIFGLKVKEVEKIIDFSVKVDFEKMETSTLNKGTDFKEILKVHEVNKEV